MSVLGFGGLLYGVSSIATDGWNNPIVLTTIIVGVIFIALFVWRQYQLDVPLLNFEVFKNKQFAVGLAIMSVTMISMIGSETVLPMFVQNVLHRSALDSGLMLLPGAIVMAIMSMISGALYERFGVKLLAFIGVIIVIVTTCYFIFMDEHTSALILTTIYGIRMIGIALSLMPIMTHTMNQLPQALNAHGSSMTNTAQQISGSIGTAALITILSQASQAFSPDIQQYSGMTKAEMTAQIKIDAVLHGYHAGFLFAVIITVISLLLTFMLKNQRQ